MTSRDTDPPAPVVVCGAGAAGMAAALAAARAGADVRLIEAGPRIGGTVAHALIHTLGGLYDSAGELLNGGLPQELVQRLTDADPGVRPRRMGRAWVLNVCPDLYQAVVERWIAAEPRITVCCGTRVAAVVTRTEPPPGGAVPRESQSESKRLLEVLTDGPAADPHNPRVLPSARVPLAACPPVLKQVPLAACPPVRTMCVPAGAAIDATGDGELVRLIDPALVEDAPGRAAGGLIVRMRGVAPGALEFPKGIGIVRALRGAAEEGALPRECGKTWIDTGVYEDEAFVKLFVPLPDDWRERLGEVRRRALRTKEAVTAFLRRLPEFAQAEVLGTGSLGIREGGRVRGEYRLTVDDVRSGRRFEDAACRCAWPIEYWDPERGVSLEYLPGNRYYEIPVRALKVRGVANVWAAGKCFSADRLAQASARVAGTCWAMGEAAGRAAREQSARQRTGLATRT